MTKIKSYTGRMQSLMILGRQPALGVAELESLYGGDKLTAVGTHAVIVDVDPCLLAFDRLGGSTKFCKLLTTLDTTDWHKIEKFLIQVSPGHSQTMPEGKMTLGLSEIGLNVGLKQLEATGLKLKKVIKNTGRPVRLVPNKSNELNAAQVIHNKLTGPHGWELVFIRDGSKTVVAQTVKVQDIESYTRRDRERPMRDAKVGMLPPKLAQILINLAVGQLDETELSNICDIPADQPVKIPGLDKTVLDPFCGTGVTLLEAMLMGYRVYGTDLDERMVRYSRDNVNWIQAQWHFGQKWQLEVGDATSYNWAPDFDFVASETYLGRPFTGQPTPEILSQTISECNLIIKKFLQNIHNQIKPGTRLCLAVPAWRIPEPRTQNPERFKHLPLIDQISDLGYNRVKFEQVRDEDLIYYREDQIVARQLLVITKE
ncbi:MAG TPA: methyltransferase domain-containing protein [Candidatus Saccharimonadales bacterium]|nr:methyltransferase domain-containing protein [Candidatus Saccharimonadales bacterium]